MALKKVVIVVKPGGSFKLIHDDAVALALKARSDVTMTTTRASDVEPTPDGRWTADMARSGGPVLGPFDTRTEALEAEVAWITRYCLGVK